MGRLFAKGKASRGKRAEADEYSKKGKERSEEAL